MARKKKATKKEEGGFSKMLATTVVLGIVFSAGLITGQRLLREQARAPMVSLSTTRAAANAVPVGDDESPRPSLRTTFSFYEHLTGNAEASPPPNKDNGDRSPAKAAEPQAEPQKAEPVEAPKEVVVAAEAKPAAAVEPPAAVKPPVATEKPAPPIAQILNEVVNSLSGEADAAKEPESDPAPRALAARYTLQVSSHPDRESAEREVGRLGQMGVEPHVIVVNVPGKGELWRVRVGKFHTMDEARDFQGSVKSRRGIAGFVTPL